MKTKIFNIVTLLFFFCSSIQAQNVVDGPDGDQDSEYIDMPVHGKDGVDIDSNQVYHYTDEMPEFKEGNFSTFIAKNYQFTSAMSLRGKPGKLVVTFVVEKDGTVSNVQTMPGKGLSPEQNAEAERVVKLSSGKWIPAKYNGALVRCKFMLPFVFPEDQFE